MHPLRRSSDPVPITLLYRVVVAAATLLALYAFAFLVVTVRAVPEMSVVESTPAAGKLASWFLLEMHGVPFSIHHASKQVAYPVSWISGWSPVYRLLPPVVLFLAGYWTARRTYVPSEIRGFIEGAKLGIAYAPFLLGVGLLALHRSTGPPGLLPTVEQRVMVAGSEVGTFAVDPNLFVVLVAGVAYPVLFAGLGGAALYEFDRYLKAIDSGPLHRLDSIFDRLDDRSEWPWVVGAGNTDLARSVAAGTLVATSQVAVLFSTRSVLQGIPEATDGGFWQALAFPVGGYLGVFVLAFAIAGLSWWLVVESNGHLRVERGMVPGGLTGMLVVLLVWGATFVETGSLPDEGGAFGAAISATVLAFLTIGLLMSLAGALSAGLLMAHHRTVSLGP